MIGKRLYSRMIDVHINTRSRLACVLHKKVMQSKLRVKLRSPLYLQRYISDLIVSDRKETR